MFKLVLLRSTREVSVLALNLTPPTRIKRLQQVWVDIGRASTFAWLQDVRESVYSRVEGCSGLRVLRV